MKRVSFVLIVLLLAVAAASCFRQTPPPGALRGTLLVWHTWPEPYGALHDSFVDSFTAVNPDVVVVSEYVDAERLQARFLDQTAAGLGPDLILGISPAVVSQLAAHDLLADLAPGIPPDGWSLHALDALQLDGALYAVPLAASTAVLFYNTRLTDAIPQTLDELVAQAHADRVVALAADFRSSFWGVDGFGGELDFAPGATAMTTGLVDWLTWLQLAQKETDIVVTSAPDEAAALFADGIASYFVGPSTLLPHLRAILGEATVGVAQLPLPQVTRDPGTEGGASSVEQLPDVVNPPGALLDLQVGVVSNVSTQVPLALALLGFITNPVQQRQLATADLGYAPLNRRVRFDLRMPSAEAVVVRQSSVAPIISLADVPRFAQLQLIADDGYAQVLGGVLEPEEGAAYIARELRQTAQRAGGDGT